MSSHVVNVVQSPVRQRRPLLQPQVSADEQLSGGYRRRVLHKSQALHHNCGHPLGKKTNNMFLFSCNVGCSFSLYCCVVDNILKSMDL